jgi:hypothetical protein
VRRIFSILLLLPLLSKADILHFAWDTSPDPFVTDYFLYASGNGIISTNSGSYFTRVHVTPVGGGTQSSYITVPAGPATMTFYVTAAYPGIESDPSVPLTTDIPVTVSCVLSASPTSIAFGGKTILTWVITGPCTYANIQPTIGNVNVLGGKTTVAPTVTTTYILTTANALSTNSCTATVTVGLPLGISITAVPSTIISNSLTTLTWTSTGPCVSTLIDQGIGVKACNSSTVVSPLVNTTYTVIAYDALGNSVTNSALVTVVAPPAPPGVSPGSLAAFRKAIIIR